MGRARGREERKGGLLSVFVPAILLLSLPLLAQGEAKRPIAFQDLEKWENLGEATLSPDGRWTAYIVSSLKGEGRVVFRSRSRKYAYSVGSLGSDGRNLSKVRPGFTRDSRYGFFTVYPREHGSLSSKKRGRFKSFTLLRLYDGSRSIFPEVKEVVASRRGSSWIAFTGERWAQAPADTPRTVRPSIPALPVLDRPRFGEEKSNLERNRKFGGEGGALTVISLKDDRRVVFSDVWESRMDDSGENIFFILRSIKNSKKNGVYRCRLKDAYVQVLLQGEGLYTNLTVDSARGSVVFLSNRDTFEKRRPLWKVYGWSEGTPGALPLVDGSTTGWGMEREVVAEAPMRFLPESQGAFLFGYTEGRGETKNLKPEVELWKWNDPLPYSQEERMERRATQTPRQALFLPKERRVVPVTDRENPEGTVDTTASSVLLNSFYPYRRSSSFEGSLYDVILADLKSGERRTLARKNPWKGYLSPRGNFVLWFGEEGMWHLFDRTRKRELLLKAGGEADDLFRRSNWDRPSPAPSWGEPTWVNGDEGLLLSDGIDLWRFDTNNGKAFRLTGGMGRKERVLFRALEKPTSERGWVEDRPFLLLHGRNQETGEEGIYRVAPWERSPQRLMKGPYHLELLGNSDDSSTYLFTRSAFDLYPDLWTADGNFSNPQRVTSLDDQKGAFFWGKEELRSFSLPDGKSLKGVLYRPERTLSGGRSPLIVVIYERMSQYFHRFHTPEAATELNVPFFVSRGYAVWMPDIIYTPGEPGQSALKCVVSSVESLLKEGWVDPKGVGITGHSFGGYETTYILTQCSLFSAGVVSAPVANMTSSYGGIRWGRGDSRQFLYERDQSRLGGSLWDMPEKYIQNSPLFSLYKLTTPLLIQANDDDDTVPWEQGIELFMALRRLEKPAYLFNYTGEGHSLNKGVNRFHWTQKVDEFFNRFLRHEAEPAWMAVDEEGRRRSSAKE